MPTTPEHPSKLTSMPEDLRLLIVSKVGNTSPQDYFNTIISCKSLSFSYKNYDIANSLNLSTFVKSPTIANRHRVLVESCAHSNNKDAHFIKGFLLFFESQNQTLGLHHLKMAADDNHIQGTYVYGVLLLAIGHTAPGTAIINQLTDDKGFSVVEDCMATFQQSVQAPLLHLKDVCVTSIINMWQDPNCHLQTGGETTICSKCYHFALLLHFYKMVMGLNDLLE